MINIDIYSKKQDNISTIVICKSSELDSFLPQICSEKQVEYIKTSYNHNKQMFFSFNLLNMFLLVAIIEEKELDYQTWEIYRRLGGKVLRFCDKNFIKDLQLLSSSHKKNILAFSEGMLYASYIYDYYKTDPKRLIHPFDNLHIVTNDIKQKDIDNIRILFDAIEKARNLINQPPDSLTAISLANNIKQFADETSIKVDIWDKQKIESEKMGGILAVNRGSINPPTFTIMEYKSEKHKNSNPIILVGKGITYDTGGLNIKTGDYMNDMKSDMAGAAIMACAVYAIARLQLDLWVVGLIPATDNRPNGNAYCSGDIINMYDGTNVEVVNTDAEGRMILADALAYAKKLNPTLVIDMATLTGAASRAIGPFGIVAMQQKADNFIQSLATSGKNVYERIVEFPFWEEYDKLIVSDIADIKNSGEKFAGMITAGKFLAYFTSYPYIHLDIAGVAMNDKDEYYIGKGATATGLRLIVDFLQTYYK